MNLNLCNFEIRISKLKFLIAFVASIVNIGGCLEALAVNQSPLPERLKEARNLLGSSERTDLDGAIHSALRRNPRLLSASSRIEARRYQLVSSERRWSPKAVFNTSGDQPLFGQYFETEIRNNPTDALKSSNTFDNYSISSLNLQLTWNFWEPSRQPAINVASLRLDSETLVFDVIARSIVLDAQLAFYELQENADLIKIYEEIYQRNLHFLEIIEAQFNNGLVSIGDVSQQKTLLLSQLITLDGLYRRQLQVASDLARIMGLQPGTSVLPAESSSDHLATWDLDMNESIESGLDLREEIRIALDNADAFEWEAKRLISLYLPVLGLVANGYKSYSRGVFDGKVGRDNYSSRAEDSYSELTIGLGFNWNFYDGGVLSAQADANRQLAAANRLDAEEERNKVGNQIRRSYAAYQTAKIALPDSQEAMQSARLSVFAASERYKAGIGNITTVVQATQLLGETSTQYKNLRVVYRNAIAELYRYSGQWPEPYQIEIHDLLDNNWN